MNIKLTSNGSIGLRFKTRTTHTAGRYLPLRARKEIHMKHIIIKILIGTLVLLLLLITIFIVQSCGKKSPSETTSSSSNLSDEVQITRVIEQYFYAYMKADVDSMLLALHPDGPMYPDDLAIKKLRETAAGNSVVGQTKITGIKIIENDQSSAQVKIQIFMKADVYGNGNFKEEKSTLVCEMKKLNGEWLLFNIKL